MERKLLGIYLNDHLAGASFGAGLADRIAHRHQDSVAGPELARLAREITEDRRALLDVMTALGVPARRYKVYGGRVAERLGLLKLNGSLYRRSGLSTVIELETLRLGVEGKSLVWRTLLDVEEAQEDLDRPRVRTLLDRAHAQIDLLAGLRTTAAVRVFQSLPGA
ncbi:hypothetical protein SLNWT_0554 [Streptomyces albus]|uniref:Uncharacterized protein n=1 Tax=Streptomyces albus (strain ATCC 21838 / DSM 41398 / FERM P-419 / JCM 4703 / NBRC 107858) TaxID=1081613 RepID=A0A0B5ENP6_STRA4|nr:hypothetical protein SLNWT_0554 [Streptomyces albus]AOU75243.1 hypothetical protein SLNHY_0552 [Streptomyces albus]AYN31048.1 hypothetical protein DUI70_0545 [Streptomyces albus]